MRNRFTIAALFLTAPALLLAQDPMKVGSLAIGAPATIAEIDTGDIKGQPSRLAWSPDGSEIYVQMMEGEFARLAAARLSHHLYKVDGAKHQTAAAEPEWVSTYWTAKSSQSSPDVSTFKIDLKSEQRVENTVSTPMGGDLAKGGSSPGNPGPPPGVEAAYNRQAVPVHTMLLHGQVVGEYVNSVIVPGQTFGWGPKGSKVIAYSAQKNGRLVVMDDTGKRQEIDDTRDTLFPAWSPDGSRLAWLQRDGRKKFVLKVARID
jgi:hypothetical protein